jgi:thioesterase domain-containing protein
VGETVPLVAILDTASPQTSGKIAARDEPEVLAGLAHEEALKVGRSISLTAAELRGLEGEARVERTLDALRQAGALAAEVDAGWVHRLLAGHHARRQAMARYQPSVYCGRLALFQPDERMTGFEERAEWSDSQGWRPWTTEPLRVHAIPGHHATMAFGANAVVLARALRAAVDDALASAGALAGGA